MALISDRVFGLYTQTNDYFRFSVSESGASAGGRAPHQGDLRTYVGGLFKSRIYRFVAERMNIGQCASKGGNALDPNCANLADVLHALQSRNPARFARFEQLVARVIPGIRAITTTPLGENVRVDIWKHDKATERVDLAMPLAASGTGVGQVLAMLYVLINSDPPRLIPSTSRTAFCTPAPCAR